MQEHSLNNNRLYWWMEFSKQMADLKQTILKGKGRRQGEGKVRLITSEKWKAMMLRSLVKLKKKGIYDSNLVDDLALIVESIHDERFVQAILNIQPFKPKFDSRSRRNTREAKQKHTIENGEETSPVEAKTKLQTDNRMHSKSSIIMFKQSVHQKISDTVTQLRAITHKKTILEQILSMVTEEQTLVKEFQARYHPFRKIIKQFLYLLQNKYKNAIESTPTIEIEKLQQSLIFDLKLLQEFIVKGSQPYLSIFKTENSSEKEMFQMKMVAFIKQYLQKNEKINETVRRIMRMGGKKTQGMITLDKELDNSVEIHQFDIKEIYRIDGCYVMSMNALMQLAEASNAKVSLRKLVQLRRSLAKDVDKYYEGLESAPKSRQICAQTQLQILKFILCKLKSWIAEIYSQLKYLQVVLGEDDMSFKYDDSSYMYAQLSVAIEALVLQHSP